MMSSRLANAGRASSNNIRTLVDRRGTIAMLLVYVGGYTTAHKDQENKRAGGVFLMSPLGK